MLFLRVTLLSCCCVFVHCIPSVSLFYPKTLTASTCSDQNSWTKWFNTVQPRSDKDFDQESFSTIQSRYGQDVCGAPCGMQARTVTPLQANASYEGSWKTSNGIISAFVSRTAGVDFQVRLCCASGQFVATTTAAPRPIPSKTCGRSKTKPSMSLSRISGGSRAVPHSWPWVSARMITVSVRRRHSSIAASFVPRRTTVQHGDDLCGYLRWYSD